jgi:hypothetical protein
VWLPKYKQKRVLLFRASGAVQVTPEQRRARAYAAQALMQDPTLIAGWEIIESEIVEDWAKPQPHDDPRAVSRREALYRELQLLRRLRQKLAGFAGQARE